MLFVEYPKCTTCQKAKKWLDENGIDYELRDIKLEKPTKKELTEYVKKLEKEMKQAAADLQFERAAQLRDQIFEYKVRI